MITKNCSSSSSETTRQEGDMGPKNCCCSSIYPPMNKSDDRRSLGSVVRVLRPLVRSLSHWGNDHRELHERLQLVDSVIQMVVQDLERPYADTAVVQTVSSNLKSMVEDLDKIFSICTVISGSFLTNARKGTEHTVRFIDSLLHILQDIYDHQGWEAMYMFFPGKKEIIYVHDELKFLKNLLWLFHVNGVPTLYLADFIENMGVKISCLLYNCLMNDKMDHTELVRDLKGKIQSIQERVRKYCRSRPLFNSLFKNVAAIKMDARVIGFFDDLIQELRKHLSQNGASSTIIAADVNDQIEILVEELSCIRCHLMDVLVLYLQGEEEFVLKQMRSLCVSANILVMGTAFLIYISRVVDIKQQETEKPSCCCCCHSPDSLEAVDSPKQHSDDFSQAEKSEEEKERANNWRFHLPGMLEDVVSLKQQAGDIYAISNHFFCLSSKSPRSTNKKGCVGFLIENLETLMLSDVASIDPLNCQIRTIYEETLSVTNCFAEIIAEDKLLKSHPHTQFLMERFEEAASKSSYIIDSIFASEGPHWYHKLGIFAVSDYIKMVQRELKAFLRKMIASDTIAHSVSCPASSLVKSPTQNDSAVGSKDQLNNTKMEEPPDEIIGVKNAVNEVIELLTSTGASRLKIISIVGMPGLGKTTLANSVYKHPSIRRQFHVQAWSCASQSYEKEALLFEILSQVVAENNESSKVRVEDLALKLRQNLKGMKYLIVIDDIWDVKLWIDLKETFPDDHNGSRILFTTRHRAVALKTNSIPYALRLLSNAESLELLMFKVFDRENCPPELSIISNRIARRCKGLPLSVILIAGILKRTEMRKDSWEHVTETVFDVNRNKTGCKDMEFSKILEFSYEHLPEYLKSCFLYFGAIPEYPAISVSKLIRLWISEDFIRGQNLGQKSLEQEADDYLNELIDRSLVMIARTGSKGGVKACRVHDVLREYCCEKLNKEGFLLKPSAFFFRPYYHGDVCNKFTTYLHDYRSNRITNSGEFHFQEVSDGFALEPRQAQSDKQVFRNESHKARETLSGSEVINNQSDRFDYDFIFKFLLLRVLDLGNVRVESSADTSDLVMISKLFHLRYLAIRPRRNEIPLEIGNLHNLETLALSGVIGYIMLPESVWKLLSLRHLLIDHGFFNFQHCSTEFFENFCHLDQLKSISTLPVRHGDNVEKIILRSLPGIQKLGCKFFADSWDDSTSCSIFPELDFLSELESLKIFFSGKVRCPFKFSFPPNLTKLSVSNSHLPWKEISVVAQLPNLEVLKLLNKAFQGEQWDMEDGEFQKLKFLKLESLDIETWNAFAPDHLPFLEQLVVLRCPKLKEIPSSLGEIATLKLIEMKWCSHSAMDSAREVAEFQRDMSNDELNVHLVGSA